MTALISIINHYDKCVIADRYSLLVNCGTPRKPEAGELVLFESCDAQSVISISPNGTKQVRCRQNGDTTIAIENLYLNKEFGYAPEHHFKVDQLQYVFR